MSPLSPTRRAAEEFANAVDGAPGDVADRYSDLLECVDVLRTHDVPAPRADFVVNLRERLMDAADTLLVPAEGDLAPVVPLHASPAARRQRRVSIAAAAFVVIGGTAGVAAAAEQSLPGDPLYPLKRGIESAQVSLNSSDSGRGQDLLRQASTRLSETDDLIANHEDPALINQTLVSFQESAAGGADLLFVEYQRHGDVSEITRLRTMLGSQLATLDGLDAEAPVGVRPAFANARTLLGNLDQQASVLCGDCGPGGISDRFASSSAPSLASLLNAPAANAQQAADLAAQNSELAEKADEIAKNSGPPPVVPNNTPTTAASPSTNPTTGLPLPTPTPGTLANPLSGLTSGVATLLNEVAGEPLIETIDKLTGGLLK